MWGHRYGRQRPSCAWEQNAMIKAIAFNVVEDVKHHEQDVRMALRTYYHVPVCPENCEFKLTDEVWDKIARKQATLLHLAAFYDALEVFLLLYGWAQAENQVQHVDYETNEKFTLLHMACAGGSSEVAAWLLSNGANATKEVGGEALTPLFLAVLANSPRVIELLFDAGLKEAKPHFERAMRVASKMTPIDCLVILLQRGPRSVQAGEMSPLMQAIVENLEDAFEPLIMNGADVNFRNAQGSSALWLAIRCGKHDLVNLLVGRGASADLPGPNGSSFVQCACRTGNLEILKTLVNVGGVSLWNKDESGKLPTFDALCAPCDKMIEILRYLCLEQGLPINEADKSGQTVFLESFPESNKSSEALLELFCVAGADFKMKGKLGRTALEMLQLTMAKKPPEVREGMKRILERHGWRLPPPSGEEAEKG